MHGGSADTEALAHRAEGLTLQHHCFHHLLLTLIQPSERGHGVLTFFGGLPIGEPVVAELIQPHRITVLQAPRR
jgi:hypothetical protein